MKFSARTQKKTIVASSAIAIPSSRRRNAVAASSCAESRLMRPPRPASMPAAPSHEGNHVSLVRALLPPGPPRIPRGERTGEPPVSPRPIPHAGDEGPPPRPTPDAPRARPRHARRGVDHPLLGRFGAGELRHEPALAHHEHAVAHPQDL